MSGRHRARRPGQRARRAAFAGLGAAVGTAVIVGTAGAATTADQGREMTVLVTGYTWHDNTPAGSDAVAYPVGRERAGGAGTFEDPVTLAVGHDRSTGQDIPDFPPGTQFYLPSLQRYGIVEDSCGDGPTPQDAPCHRPPAGVEAHLDLWVGGSDVSASQAAACASALTGTTRAVLDPPAGLPVAPGYGLLDAGRCLVPAAPGQDQGSSPVSTPAAPESAPTPQDSSPPSPTASQAGASQAWVWDAGVGAWGLWRWQSGAWALVQTHRPDSNPAPAGGAITVRQTTSTWTGTQGASAQVDLWAPADGTRARGVVVYLDGDGMHGVTHPQDAYALGGQSGIVAQAAARGYATVALTPPGGQRTWYGQGDSNATLVRDVTSRVNTDLGVDHTWWVGYSGGAQLISKYLLPAYGQAVPPGGALLLGGGGPPSRAAVPPVGYPMFWYTGADDTGAGSSDGYDALADARAGAQGYGARGARALIATPPGDHDDVTGQMGAILTSVLPQDSP